MEILKITDSKMKVTLDGEDMKNYLVSERNLDCASPASRKKLWSILDAVKSRCGFDIAGERAFIQCYPSREGGCEMFITKLGSLLEGTERAIVRSGKVAMVSKVKNCFLFESLSDLCRAVRHLAPTLSAERSDVYLCEGGGCLLTVEERRCSDGGEESKLPLSCYSFSEYSTAVFTRSNVFSPAYLSEHTKCLTKGDALSVFAEL